MLLTQAINDIGIIGAIFIELLFSNNEKMLTLTKTQDSTINGDSLISLNAIITNDSLNDPQILNQLPVAVYVCDINGHIIQHNEKAVQLWGRKPSRDNPEDLFFGARLFSLEGSFIPDAESPVAATILDSEPRENIQLFMEKPDCTRITISLNVVPLKDDHGHTTGSINCFYEIDDLKNISNKQDDTISRIDSNDSEDKLNQLSATFDKNIDEKTQDLKRKNEELRKSEERYHKMIEEVEDYAIILLDKNGIIQNWNKGAEKIKGYKEEEILGKSFQIFYSEKDRESGLATNLLEQARNYGKAIHEGWRMRKDGSTFWGSIVITALHDDEDNIIGFSKVTRDLTERKLAEDKLKEYTSELEFQNKELEQFAYAASHDMKEPLRKIHFYNTYISEMSADKLDEKSKLYLSRSLNAVSRMSALIEDLLTYSRTNSNAESLAETDLNKIMEEVRMIHKDEIEQKKVRIQVGPLPIIKAVPFQVKQLMENLVNNSIKYKHPQREAVINISSTLVNNEMKKEQDIQTTKQYHKISVIDNGIGFEPKYAGKIFEIFQRLNNHAETSGSGIGLAICNRIVQNHKGFIKASGHLNEGARFDVYFPADH